MASTIAFDKAHIGSSLFRDYWDQQIDHPLLQKESPTLQHLEKTITAIGDYPYNRKLLVEALLNQYKASGSQHKNVLANIAALEDENTFTVITGHQACLLTGPAYFIYKIVSAIALCQKLEASFPGKRFIPVYWMNSEDHDFEEVNHFFLGGKKWSWDKPVQEEMAVGRMPTTGIPELLEKVKAAFPQQHVMGELLDTYSGYYKTSGSLAEATYKLVDHLFSAYGLVVFDQDEPVLKAVFLEKCARDIWEQTSFEKVTTLTAELVKKGYAAQVTPREINFFFHSDQGRKRIVAEENGFAVLDTNLRFSKETLLKMIGEHPEHFSTNVITRPLYQQSVFPNIAYIGGPAEVHYWLQLRSEFEAFDMPFPVVLMRDSFLILRNYLLQKAEKLGLQIEDFFQDEDELIRNYILEHHAEEVDMTKTSEALEQAYMSLQAKIAAIDKTLLHPLTGERQKALNGLIRLEGKIIRRLKAQEALHIQQIREIRSSIFPGGIFQERREQFLNFTADPKAFIKLLLQHADCLVPGIKLIADK